MKLNEFEKRRAANLIWNAAGNYGISPGFRMYDAKGRADLYWNSIIGAAHRYYDWDRLMEFYQSFHETVDQGVYESLFWLALENSTFEKMRVERPAAAVLREHYAREQLKNFMPSIAESREGWILEGHYRTALGEDSGLPDLVDRKLLKALELPGDLDTEAWIREVGKILARYFTYLPGAPASAQKHRRFALPKFVFRKRRMAEEAEPLQPNVRRLAMGFGEALPKEGSETGIKNFGERYQEKTEAQLWQYIHDYFGAPLYEKAKERELMSEFCTGAHAGSRLYLTDGRLSKEARDKLKGFPKRMRREMELRYEKTKRAHEGDLARDHAAVTELRERLKNALQQLRDPEDIPGKAGQLIPGRLYRALCLNDNRIFAKRLPGDESRVSVDILLDASTSQEQRTELVARQAYILAESLSALKLPLRVWGYLSMSGYTVLTRYLDYGERGKNQEIFRYFTAGANRDGLAYRTVCGLMEEHPAERKILIVLSDVKPNDIVKIRYEGQDLAYSGKAAVENCAEELRQARGKGITPLCVYTGDEAGVADVQRIFGQNFVKINSLNRFAAAAGKLLEGALSNPA